MENTKNDLNKLSVKGLFEQDDVKKRFYEMLGKKATGFIVSIINVVSNDRNLVDADRSSILFASAIAATLDLPINPNLGFAYIIPYRGRDGKQKAQFQLGYKGFIQLAQRSGLFKTISATPIYKGQILEENPLTGYKFDFTKKDSDEIVGYAGFFQLINGFEKTLYMTIKELKGHGKKYSQTYKKGFGLWEDDFDAMATKTVLKLLLARYAPLSIEMQKAVVVDQSIAKDWEGLQLEYPDNTLPTIDEVAKQKEEERIEKYIKKAKTIEELKEAEEYIVLLPKDHELVTLFNSKLKKLGKE